MPAGAGIKLLFCKATSRWSSVVRSLTIRCNVGTIGGSMGKIYVRTTVYRIGQEARSAPKKKDRAKPVLWYRMERKLEVNQPTLYRNGDRLGAVVRVELGQNRGDVKFDGTLGNAQRVRDFLVSQTLCQQTQHV